MEEEKHQRCFFSIGAQVARGEPINFLKCLCRTCAGYNPICNSPEDDARDRDYIPEDISNAQR